MPSRARRSSARAWSSATSAPTARRRHPAHRLESLSTQRHACFSVSSRRSATCRSTSCWTAATRCSSRIRRAPTPPSRPPRSSSARRSTSTTVRRSIPSAPSLNEDFPAIPQRRALPATLERLAALGPAGPTGPARRAAPAQVHAPAPRRGGHRFRLLRSRRHRGRCRNSLHGLPHKLLLVRLAREADASPQLDGELSLEDCETGDDLRVTITPATLEVYQRPSPTFEDKLLDFADKRRAGYVTLNADGDVLEQFMDMFTGGLITTYG